MSKHARRQPRRPLVALGAALATVAGAFGVFAVAASAQADTDTTATCTAGSGLRYAGGYPDRFVVKDNPFDKGGISFEVTEDGKLRMADKNADGDVGVVTRKPVTLGSLQAGVGVSGSDNLATNLWIDGPDDGKRIFEWSGNRLTSVGTDAYYALDGTDASRLGGDGPQNATLTELVDHFGEDAHVQVWVGINAPGEATVENVNGIAAATCTDPEPTDTATSGDDGDQGDGDDQNDVQDGEDAGQGDGGSAPVPTPVKTEHAVTG